MKGAVILILLLLGSPVLAAAPGTPGSPLGVGPAPDYLPCDPEGLKGEIDANMKSLSVMETQIRALESQRATARTQMLALDPSDQTGRMQRGALQRQYDTDTGRIAMLEMNANTMRNHIAELQAKRISCGPKPDSTKP